MCLMALAWQPHERFAMVLAANRDEFHRRPTTPMAWWADGHMLAGKDLEAGGTWLGISRHGRIGLLTNVREPGLHREGLASRGHIVPLWLEGSQASQQLRSSLAGIAHNGYNLLALDVPRGHAHWTSNRHGHLDPLPPGLYGLSNAALDTPWPKLMRLKRGVADVLGRYGAAAVSAASDRPMIDAVNEALAQPSASEPETLLESMIELLVDRHQPPDEELPRTGVPQEWERMLGRVFIETPDQAYGTRCSTAIVVERLGQANWRLHALEQGWDPQGRPTTRSRHRLEGRFTA